jgi:Amt family ammonium transporter
MPALLILAVCLITARVATAWDSPPPIAPSESMVSDAVARADLLPGLRQFTLGEFDSGRLSSVMVGTLATLLLAPGLALFYCGLSCEKKLPDVLIECLFPAAVLSVTWVLWIYSLAFSRNEFSYDVSQREIQSRDERFRRGNRFIGGARHFALRGLDSNVEITTPKFPLRRPDDAIPHLLFMVFQMGIFVSAAAPLAVLLRARLHSGGAVLFLVVWGTIVYAPIAYWVWGGGWHASALDYAGGIVVHVSVGCSALALALWPRSPREKRLAPAEPDLACLGIGTILFWGGSLLGNASHALSANVSGVNALVATHLAVTASIMGWSGSEWLLQGNVRLTGICAGAMSGLFAIAAGCGYVAPQSAISIGLVAGIAGQAAFRSVARPAAVNPFLALFALQGLSGGFGVVLAALFATASVAGVNRKGDEIRGALSGNFEQLTVQCAALGSAVIWAVVGTIFTAWIVRRMVRRDAGPSDG